MKHTRGTVFISSWT